MERFFIAVVFPVNHRGFEQHQLLVIMILIRL